MLAKSSVNHRAHSLWTAVLVALPVALAGSGCIIVDDDDDDDYYDDPPVDPGAESVGIDAGATLEAEPGLGAGVFVEHAGFGEWYIWTTCDTELTGYGCYYDIYVSADGLGNVEAVDLEGGDLIDEGFEDVHVALDNDYDYDGFAFSTFEGEPVLIEVWVDGSPDGRLVFWVENDEVWQGMPTNPTFFIP